MSDTRSVEWPMQELSLCSQRDLLKRLYPVQESAGQIRRYIELVHLELNRRVGFPPNSDAAS